MIFVPIAKERLPFEWDWLSARVRLPNLRQRLETESIAVKIEGTDLALILGAGVTKDTGVVALWIEALGGSVGFRPKENRALMRRVLAECEQIARDMGCQEIRIEAQTRGALKQRLFAGFGFEPFDALGKLVMRRTISNG